MSESRRKVCVAGSVRTRLAQKLLEQAGCEIVLGGNINTKGGLISLIGDAEALLVSGWEVIDREVLEPSKHLQAVVKGSIGVEKIDLKAATRLGILVCNSPAHENFVGLAEATVGLIAALFKRLKLNEAQLRSGRWKNLAHQGDLMAGKTIGLIGFGRVGRETARRLGPWGVQLIAYSPNAKQDEAEALGVKLVSLEDVLRESDLISIHVVLTSETRHMMTLRELRIMKPTAYLVNTSRGAVIREEDLVRALNEGIIAGAALDVFEEEPLPRTSPLREVDPTRLILTPHSIGSNRQSLESGQRMGAESILSILEGKAPETVLNPEAIDRWRARFWS